MSTGKGSKSVKFCLNEGNKLKNEGKLDQAIEKYNQALQINPDCLPAFMHLGEIYDNKGEPDQAISYYKKVINLKPDNSMANAKLGRVMMKVGDKEGAIQAYQKAILFKADPPQWVYNDLKNALETNEYFKVCFDLGVEFFIQGNTSEAIHWLIKAIEIKPTFLPAFVKLLAIQNQSQVSREDWLHLIKGYQTTIEALQKSLHFAYLNLGIALSEVGEVNQAIACNQTGVYQKILESKSNFFNQSLELGCSNKPSFLIIGAPKCGTSSLYSYITEHPNVISPLLKEINFFNKNFSKGINWYLSHFALLPEGKYVTGEATPLYLYHSDTPERVSDCFPDVKLIIILRNPVDRAISDYYHRARNKRLKMTFEEVFSPRLSEFQGVTNILENENYLMDKNEIIWRGMYFSFVEKWMNLFSREQVMVLQNEDLLENPGMVMQNVFKFLDIPSYESSSYAKKNVGSYSSLPDSIREEFSKLYHYHNQRLEDYLEIKLNW